MEGSGDAAEDDDAEAHLEVEDPAARFVCTARSGALQALDDEDDDVLSSGRARHDGDEAFEELDAVEVFVAHRLCCVPFVEG
ncbi:hypothetical protein PHSY_006040 [Pseudozyma hubeiensis SY62]|uniref:Uncharacterized protein n=1 Tax=Pseudozyma hubeiensis (strain SY62) TaxID=1305764 RepID=R9PAQ1_PSEHS|nr:hypothetical protein PHSY_006040 [Pseudozyma hubeiensis SY62]GAC98446.1 hypothetical protein PHSY_006040 [Pseudozyma hubeiensis SY62]